MKTMKHALLALVIATTSLPTTAMTSGVLSLDAAALAADYPALHLPTFAENCSEEQKTTLSEAHITLGNLMDDAIGAATYLTDSQEYKYAFGTYDEARHKLILERFKLIRIGAAEAPIQLSCPTKEEHRKCKYATAEVPKRRKVTDPFEIIFCAAYFNVNREIVRKLTEWSEVADFQAAVFLHEMTHMAWDRKADGSVGMNAGTTDHKYLGAAVKELAADSPDKSVANADSYSGFMMWLAVRNRSL